MYDYIYRVLNRLIPCSKAVEEAVKQNQIDRHNMSWEWIFHEGLAAEAIEFMNSLPNYPGQEPIELYGFQKFITGMFYGWVNKKDPTIRRFNRSFISMARGNGKSVLESGFLLYDLLNDYLKNYRLYCLDYNFEKSKLKFKNVKDRAEALMDRDSKYQEVIKVEKNKITNLITGSTIEPISLLSQEFKLNESTSDHSYRDTKCARWIEGTESVEQNLNVLNSMIMTTTSDELNNILNYERNYSYAKEVLAGSKKDERLFVFIAEQDQETEADEPRLWIKSNPLMVEPSLAELISEHIKELIERDRQFALVARLNMLPVVVIDAQS